MDSAPLHQLKDHSLYGYTPTEWISIMFIVLYGLSFIIHLGQVVKYRMWWMLATTCLAGALEMLGWGGRLWSFNNLLKPGPYEMQITCTILGPTPLLAANFVILGMIIEQLGPQYSHLSPKLYTVVFCTCDVISLVVQAVGGGMAATAVNKGTNPAKGGNIMLGGIAFQMLTITVYGICALEFFVRYSHDTPVARSPLKNYDSGVRGAYNIWIKSMSGALLCSTVCLWIRAVYRTIELANGFTGRIIQTQILFNVLDGGMVTLAIYTLNFFHPGFILGRGEDASVIEDVQRKAS